MKLLFILFLLTSINVFSNNNTHIEVTSINSPVKGEVAKFLIKVPSGFEIDSARYRIKNSTHIIDKSNKHDPIVLTKQGLDYIAQIEVNKLPPGQYQFFLKVKDKKTKREHDCKNKTLKDYINFVIDESMEVAIPNEKENNKTLEGIDQDDDGIRDDIQRWINGLSETYEVKQALKQAARGLQLSIVNSDKGKEVALQSLDYFEAGLLCFWGYKGFLGSNQIDDSMKKNYLNTLERTKSYLQTNHYAHGRTTSMPNSKNEYLLFCQF